MRQTFRGIGAIGLLTLSLAQAQTAHSQELVRVAVPQRGTWETSVPDLGDKSGIFAKHGVKLETLYTSGGGETMQALISGGVDVAISTGAAAMFAAYAKGRRCGRSEPR